ncbi:hypothetical protein A8924_0453 [Saccharopolyspora erythraea NRRL 2338]|uniref:Uncharacterized protein n=2 Tax=Saccharopolyspora erythraea TaxID=1836 RepID=A4F5U7_SACEN|nr:hypothetical protein [Saccharopolyspora erythraea]EQD84202.1 hypothetical protein N599_21145 [Saccharopolyspora erythraea D]PFG93220.1 hypothetical protein A8924_0453 [Saccharopolyspora erythraea NRRL 2338]QRK90077.1 hypothetical protein JQX30_00335 [Saccharopolyspora erythraea]QUG99453.1 hypothetical protein HUO13_00320 [Saccharopolyspora erythraea]CAL99421.1 hypothetical protein SACE_0068 [Saccharopolyspora erythraea NRRL 2338]
MDSTEQQGDPAGPAESSGGAGDRTRWWRFHCRDATNAPRDLTVLVNRDKVVLVGPPGETAVLSTGGAGELSTALRAAAEQARK